MTCVYCGTLGQSAARVQDNETRIVQHMVGLGNDVD